MSLDMSGRGHTESSRKTDVVLTERGLVTELRAFAYNNPRFRRGEVDEVNVTVSEATCFNMPELAAYAEDEEEGELTEALFMQTVSPELFAQPNPNKVPTGPEQREVPDGLPSYPSDLEVGYQFRAHRIESKRPGVVSDIAFSFGIVSEHTDIQLPVYIAQEISGLQGQEAVDEYGFVTLERTLIFNIFSSYPMLSTSEGFRYTDIDDEVLYAGSSDFTGYDADPFYIASDEESDDMSGDTLTVSPVVQLVTEVNRSRLTHEAINPGDFDGAVKLWSEIITEPPEGLEEAVEEENLLHAFHVFRGLKQALRKQAGLK